MSFSERVEKLDREIGATVEQAFGSLRRELTERLRAGHEQLLRSVEEIKPDLPSRLLHDDHVAPIAEEATGAARQSAFAELRDAVAAIDSARSQAAILSALLAGGRHFAARTAILLVRGGRIQGWGAEGFGHGEQAIRELTIDGANDGAWGHLAAGGGALALSAAECADLCSRLESPLPHDGVLVPLVLRDQLVAALYADRGDGGDLLIEGLQTLTYVASQAIESLPFRERESTATLRLADAPLAPTAPIAPAPAPEAPAEAAPATTTPTPPATPEAAEPAGETATAASEPAPETAAAPQALTHEIELPTQPTPASPPSSSAETVLMPRAAFGEMPAKAEPAPPPPAPTPPSAPAASEPADENDETHPGVLRPVAPPAPTAPVVTGAAGGTGAREEARTVANPIVNPEVRPPSGVQGPGWAFATTRVNVAADDEALHEEARRLARLLVSEIKLYNEEQVDEGRRNRDLYERLKEDIDRSRQMYEERVDPRVLRSTDYFYQELVRILAAGDSKALGI
jgi:hypothetical protein